MMKIRMLIPSMLLAAAAAPVWARGGHCGGGAGLGADLPALFSQADADGDGALSPDEFKTFQQLVQQHRAAARFQRLDANGDGKVTLDEIQQHIADRQAHKHGAAGQ